MGIDKCLNQKCYIISCDKKTIRVIQKKERAHLSFYFKLDEEAEEQKLSVNLGGVKTTLEARYYLAIKLFGNIDQVKQFKSFRKVISYEDQAKLLGISIKEILPE